MEAVGRVVGVLDVDAQAIAGFINGDFFTKLVYKGVGKQE